MWAKEYLRQVKLLDVKIRQMQEQADCLRQMATGSGGGMQGERVQTSPEGDTLARRIAKYVDLEADIDRTIDKYVDMKLKIVGEIHSLPDARHVEILYKRYVDMKTFEAIAVEAGYSYDHVRRLHGNALQAFEQEHNYEELPEKQNVAAAAEKKGRRNQMETWRYDLSYPGKDDIWETGFESYNDAYEAMNEAMTEIIIGVAVEHPEMTDEEIEAKIDWEVRME